MPGPPKKLSIEDPFADSVIPAATLAPAPSGGDDFATLQAAFVAAQASGLRLVLQPGTYLISAPLTLADGTAPIVVVGIPPTDSGGTTIKANGAMRSVIDVLSAYSRFSNLILDANRLANYGVYFESATSVVFDHVWEQNALLDGFHCAITGINQGITLSQCRARGNGKTYATAGILAQYPASLVRQAAIAGTAATIAGNAVITIAGAPDLTTLGIRAGYNGDMIRVGATSTTSFYGQILAVTANTVTVHNSSTGAPVTTASGQAYAIGVGFGWYEQVAATNGFCVLDDLSIFRENGCGGVLMNALYGDAVRDCLCDYNNFCGIALGLISNDTALSGAVVDKVYMEANIGPDYVLGGARDAEIRAPQGGSVLSTGFFSIGGQVLGSSGLITRNGVSETWQNGAPQNFLIEVTNAAGTRQHRFTSDHFVPTGTAGNSKILAPSGIYSSTPLISNVVGFSAGAGILASTPEYLILDTPIAQGGGPMVNSRIVFNDTGTHYYAAIMPLSVNINGVTQTRYAIRLTDVNGNLIQWSTAVIGAGKTISVQIDGRLR
jgi:hypothetical protein